MFLSGGLGDVDVQPLKCLADRVIWGLGRCWLFWYFYLSDGMSASLGAVRLRLTGGRGSVPIRACDGRTTAIPAYVWQPTVPRSWGEIRCSQTGHWPGSGPTATGIPAVAQSLHEPGYRVAGVTPAISMAKMLWHAVTPDPQ